MLQISSGLLRGLQLRSPQGDQTRPSSERLRQGIFNVLRHYRWLETVILENAAVVDIFAGTGAWGLEALSNGASEAVFVESHPLALKALSENMQIVRASFEAQGLEAPKMTLLKWDVSRAYPKLPPARVVFCDPPYGRDWFEKVSRMEAQKSCLVDGGLFLFEAEKQEKIAADSGSGLRLFDTKIYGDSAVHFFVKQGNDPQGHLSG